MYPNPQDALPLPSRPNLEQYRKLAKDLVKACRSGTPDAIRVWAGRWVAALASAQHEPRALGNDTDLSAHVDRIAEFAGQKLSGGDGESSPKCVLADAQFVIARAHGFPSWPTLVTQLESHASARSPASAFEAAASAIVAGDIATLERLLREQPDLMITA